MNLTAPFQGFRHRRALPRITAGLQEPGQVPVIADQGSLGGVWGGLVVGLLAGGAGEQAQQVMNPEAARAVLGHAELPDLEHEHHDVAVVLGVPGPERADLAA
jgi:hypothetical protein